MVVEDPFRHADARRKAGGAEHKLRRPGGRTDHRARRWRRRAGAPHRTRGVPGHAFADARRKPNATTDKYVSLINRASVAALDAAVEAPVDPLRFRANVYLDGAPAWSELDWIGSEIALGGARLRVIAAITRCAATEVNPATAERDLDIVGALQRGFGHNLMGIYAAVVTAAEIGVGDGLRLLPAPARTG